MVANLMRGWTACRNFRALLLLCAVPSVALAQELADPTRPPAEISAPSVQAGQNAVQEGDKLQSVIISTSRRAAIINGQIVELGAKQGDARLVEVSEGGVVLQGPQGRQALALFPGVGLKKRAPALPEQKIKNAGGATKKSPSARKAAEPAAPKEKK